MGPAFAGPPAGFLASAPPSIHLLVGVDAPQALLLDPAVKALACDMAPMLVARLHLGDDAGLQARGDRARRIGAVIERREIVLVLHGDDRSASSRQQRVIDPAFGAFGVA